MHNPEISPFLPSMPDTPFKVDLSNHPGIQEAVALATGKPYVLVLDGDETLFNSIKKHHSSLERIFHRAGIPPEQLPSYDALLASEGDMDRLYGHIAIYNKFHQLMMDNRRFNTDVKPIHPDHPKLVTEIAQSGFKPVLLLTTRPEKLDEVTQSDLLRHGYPYMPVCTRPSFVERSHTTAWKMEVLTYLSTRIDGTILMIDDSKRLAEAIRQLNNPRIRSVLYKGPMTNDTEGFDAANWHEMLSLLQSITNPEQ